MIIPEIESRRSIRDFKPDPVDPDALGRILEAGRLAPTARNQQDWRLIIIDDQELKNRLLEAASPHQPFLRKAPIVLIACGLNPDYIMRCGQAAYPIDLAIVLDHVSLQAVREGLGTCWIGSFSEIEVKHVLAIPERVRVVQLMALGCPAETPAARPRKDLSGLIARNQW